MNADQIVLLLKFFKAAKEVQGRKKLQKMIYLLQVKGYPFNQKFDYHYYGPYSGELADQVALLVESGRIKERTETTFSGYQTYNYVYNEGNQEVWPNDANLDREFVGDVHRLNELEARDLELFATVAFLLQEGKTREYIMSKLPSLKAEQNYTTQEIERAFEFLKEWRNVG